MRKGTVRNGMRCVMAALLLIILASFYHTVIADLFLLSPAAGDRVYRLGIFWATAIGSYGVVLTALGFVLSSRKGDDSVRIMPTFLVIAALMALFFYLLTDSITNPVRHDHKRLRPGETITI